MASGGSSLSSSINQGATSSTIRNVVMDESESTEVQVKKIFHVEGYAPEPIIAPSNIRQADYYRYGKPAQISEEGLYPTKAFDILPKTLEDWPEHEASIRVRGKKDGTGEPTDLIAPYTKLLLEQVSESHAERSQIVETFGDFYVFLYGQRPPVYTYSGTLINTKNVNWLSDFMFYYENYLRGTRCVENDATIVLTYGGRQVEGYILGTSTVTSAALEAGARLTFQVLILSRKYLGFSEDFGIFQQGYSDTLYKDENFSKFIDAIAGNEGNGTANPDYDAARKALNVGMGATPPGIPAPLSGAESGETLGLSKTGYTPSF